ncbi:MAG: hypothetical protein J5I90_03740 [Caldilineales bacterium]|nr:hypothetical protein [Caldilineales bacterium]
MPRSRIDQYLLYTVFLVLLLAQAYTLYALYEAQSEANLLAAETEQLMSTLSNPQQRFNFTSVEPVVVTSRVQLPDVMQTHIIADIPIDEIVTISDDIKIPLPNVVVGYFELETPDIPVRLETDVQINTVLHIDQIVPVQIPDDFAFTAEIPIHTDMPVSVDFLESPIYKQAQIIRTHLQAMSEPPSLIPKSLRE